MSACTQRVRACFLEKDIEFEIEYVDLQSGEHKRPNFLALQPFGQVPVIEDGEFKLFESRAIIRYYAAKHTNNGPDLVGSTMEERAVVDQWLEVEAHNFNDLVYTLVMQTVILPRVDERHCVDTALVDSLEEKPAKVLDVYDERLGRAKYLAGPGFTLADLTNLPGMRYLVDEVKMGHLLASRKNVKAWWDDISARPAWKNLMAIAGFD